MTAQCWPGGTAPRNPPRIADSVGHASSAPLLAAEETP
jgi:hypothetical protein